MLRVMSRKLCLSTYQVVLSTPAHCSLRVSRHSSLLASGNCKKTMVWALIKKDLLGWFHFIEVVVISRIMCGQFDKFL